MLFNYFIYKIMVKVINVFKKIRNIFEIYIPTVAFTIMFLVFILQIIMRYIFNNPLIWTHEVSVIGFTWTVILGACYAMRHRSHVTFTLIHDMLSERNAPIIRIFGNIILLVAFVLLIKPSYEFVQFMSFKSTSVLKIKVSWVYMPFIYFLLSIIFYTLEDIVVDCKKVKGYKTETTVKIDQEV